MAADVRALHLRSSAGLYGAEYVILGLLPALGELGVASTLLCLDNQYRARQPLAESARALGIQTINLPCRGRFDFATIEALRRVLAQHPDAVLHVHDYKSALTAWLARGRRDIPIVATSHGQFSSTASLRFYHRVELSLMRRFDRVCIVSAAMRPVLARAGIDDAKVRLIENGIDTQRFRPDVPALARSEFGIAPDAIVFGSAMRLTEQKDPIGLIEAFAHVVPAIPHAMLVIAGDGPLLEAARARSAQLRIADRVRLVGARDDLERFYPMLDVFVLASCYEGLPLALLEAMAAQRCIVATAVGEIPAVLEGLAAELVAPGDRDALAHALRAAVSQPYRAALRQRVIERHSVQAMAAAYASVYRELRRTRERAAA